MTGGPGAHHRGVGCPLTRHALRRGLLSGNTWPYHLSNHADLRTEISDRRREIEAAGRCRLYLSPLN